LLYIFDVGGVLLKNCDVTPSIASHLGISESEFYRYSGKENSLHSVSPYNWGDLALLQRGEITTETFWQNWEERSGIPVQGDPWYDYFNPELIESTAETITKLRKQGSRVVCGSNIVPSHGRKIREMGFYDYFDATYLSSDIGLIKPDPEFFRYILASEKARPEDTVFYDDMEENIRAAAALGIDARLFGNTLIQS
jgi:putative hydrolase of the HAD superfamily